MSENEPADRFARMSRLIIDNTHANFGGAAVIIPPSVTGTEKPIEVLLLDSSGDPAQFLSTILSRIQIMLREIEDKQRMTGAFGGR